jgi:DNA mismatch repair ATPase MutS
LTAKEKRYAFLQDGSSILEKNIIEITGRIRLITISRVIAVLAGIFLFYQYLKQELNWPLYLALTFLGLFVFLVRWYFKLKDKLATEQALLAEYDMELDYLNGKLPELDAESKLEISTHPFAQDLNLFGKRSLYHHLNRSFSEDGGRIIQEDLASQEVLNELEERQEALKELKEKEAFLLKFRSLGRGIDMKSTKVYNLIEIWKEEPLAKISWFLRSIMLIGQAFVIYALISFLINPAVETFKVLNYAFILNLLIFFSQFKRLQKQHQLLDKLSEAMQRYGRLILHLEKHSFRSEGLNKHMAVLSSELKASESLIQLSKLLSSLEQMANVLVLIFLNGLFHYHLHRFHSLAKWKNKHSDKLSQWIDVTVEFELLSSYANYIQNHPEYIWPQKRDEPILIAKEMSHPLLPADQSVSNSYSFNDFRQMILTGSNMSGKSTFLRTIGLNLILAKRGLTVAAEEFAFYPFQVLSSMNPSDNIHENTSYFQAEIIRLKRLLDSINKENTSLLLLDEILRGTNSDDKKEGTRLFLEKIAHLNCLGIVATHDVDISNLRKQASDIFAAYYFESTVEGGELKFDYKLREGVCLTPNATSLMRNYGII